MPSEREAREALKALVDKYHALTSDQREDMTERDVIHQFITPMFRDVLGWPVADTDRYQHERTTAAGRADIIFTPENEGRIFIEAKRFGVIQPSPEVSDLQTGAAGPRQLPLPGMAPFRTREEQQAINYAFQERGQWAILTNFERLRLFNAQRDWLVAVFDTPDSYLGEEFNLLWQLAYVNIRNGSLTRLSEQRYTRDVDTKYLSFINQWRERLAQDIVARPWQNTWAFHADGSINLPRLRRVVQRFLDRLVIVRFAEDHFVIPVGTLRQFYDLRHNDYSIPLDGHMEYFFRRFDARHNSALFALDWTDRAIVSDRTLHELIDTLYQARYRSMTPDIIGNTYEQYLGQTLALDNGSVTARDNVETRKKQGSYYTPQVIVRYIVDHSLGRYLYGTADGRPDGQPIAGETPKTSRNIADLRVLDSACGSGSFLIYAYEVLAGFYRREIRRWEAAMVARAEALAREGLTQLEIRAEMKFYTVEIERLRDYPRLILETHLYGVDLDPQAAEIAVVNLIMRAMEDRRREQQMQRDRIKRLPLILGQNVKVGNTLVGLRADHPLLADHADALAELVELRAYLTTDPDQGVVPEDAPYRYDQYRSMTLEDAHAIPNPAARAKAIAEVQQRMANPPAPDEPIDRANPTYYELHTRTRAITDQLDAALQPHFSDLDRVRPFHWGAEFPEVFYDADGQPLDNPGFTVIIGNPPWEIVMPDEREFYAQFDPDIESKLQGKRAEARIEELDKEDPRRRTTWEAQKLLVEETAAYVRCCGDFEHQGRGHTATQKLFTERAYDLLRDSGRLGYIIPSGIYSDPGTKELREMLLDKGRIESLIGLTNGVAGGGVYFADVHRSYKIALLVVFKGIVSSGFKALFRIDPRTTPPPDEFLEFVANLDNYMYVSRDSLDRFSPDNLAVMEFQTRQDYEIYEMSPLKKG